MSGDSRRNFLKKSLMVGSLPFLAGSAENNQPINVSKINSAIPEDRGKRNFQKVYAGRANRLYDHVPQFLDSTTGKAVLHPETVDAALGEDHSKEELVEHGKNRIFDSSYGVNLTSIGKRIYFNSTSHDFPEKRLFEDGEARIDLISLQEQDGLDHTLERLSNRLEPIVESQLDIDFNICNKILDGRKSQERKLKESQKTYLEEEPWVIQTYLTTRETGVAGSSRPNHNTSIIQIPDKNTLEWSDNFKRQLPHLLVHESVGHSLLDISFHDFTRESVMSYNFEEADPTSTSIEGVPYLWAERYLESDLEYGRKRINNGNKEQEVIVVEYEPGKVDHARDIKKTRENVRAIMRDRYEIGPNIEFEGFYTKETEDSVLDIHEVDVEGELYSVAVDHYLKEISHL